MVLQERNNVGFLKLLFIKTCCILMISLMAFLGGGLLARLRPYPLSKAIIPNVYLNELLWNNTKVWLTLLLGGFLFLQLSYWLLTMASLVGVRLSICSKALVINY